MAVHRFGTEEGGDETAPRVESSALIASESVEVAREDGGTA